MGKCPIYFTDYEKISDTLLIFGGGAYCLKFNVKLAKRGKNDFRSTYHSETVYKMQNPYSNTNDDLGCSMTRKVDSYFFSIEATSSDNRAYDNSIYIYPHDIYYIKYVFEQALTWFDQNNDIFGTDPNGQYRLRKIVNPVRYYNIRFPEKYIDIVPEVVDLNKDVTTPGIVMYLNGNDNYIEMNVGEFFGLYWLITHTDMYGLVSSMLCYIKSAPHASNVNMMNLSEDEEDYFWDRHN